ncbi:FAD/NAD(P)-binding oxidoreductase [Bradyrhizobium sp. SSUT18]|uniref:NAD(P)/FAD-dependent oxidoreductase n=1 Tax=Bradyrhizobium sp. SSUT18 TaxID=3040602 RepID=UPI00244D0DC7|nr:FAD/NAD(P)-binding oxidoreductase [Bradyrhizobium sp. SSUT18]MDH2401807.1 FAD/NAD(P)-binding oxidoreductase [Bradyrhizobium sp. SSUT18]
MPQPYCDVAIVGGSIAGLRAAQTVARHAPDLTITMISDETHPPYERPPLSKVGLTKQMSLDALIYPAVNELRSHGVNFLLGTTAEELDVDARKVVHSSGTLHYRSLVIATGCEAIIPPALSGLPDIFTLRRYDDAVSLRRALANPLKSVAIVGAGFIGGELASMLANEGRRVALIDLARKPLGRFGEPVFRDYEALHRGAGVVLRFGEQVVDVVDQGDGRVLELGDGSRVPADVIVLGVGVRPSTEWLQQSGLRVENGIHCDGALRAADHVFAAGDVVRWPNQRWDTDMRVEHWTNAAEQGRVAGINAANDILGLPLEVCANVPYFWSDQHGVRIQFAGHRAGDEEIIESRNSSGSLFIYRRSDIVTGVLAFERRADFVKIRTMLKNELTWQPVRSLIDRENSR